MARVAVVGGGPAGLMAAESLSAAGAEVVVYEKMPTVGRKLLIAGRGGLNLTHSEPFDRFAERYGAAAGRLRPLLEAFPPSALVAWAEGLGQPTFVGSSGRVFPKALKASPLLRAWLARLAGQGVRIETRRTWRGWDAEGRLLFDGEAVQIDAVVLALGGASWPRLGSDAGWVGMLEGQGAAIAPFRPANCGFTALWTPLFRERFAGTPLKSIALTFAGRTVRGEAMVAAYGLEGGAVYALSAPLRDAIEAEGEARVEIDLRPDLSAEVLTSRLGKLAGGKSLSDRLRRIGLAPVAIGLLREGFANSSPQAPAELANTIKAVPLVLTGTASIERAISSAGGVRLPEVDDNLMLRLKPGVFVAGEMLDWEAPTGGYLLQACFATGLAAGKGAANWLSL